MAENLWSTLLNETSRKPQLLDATCFIFGDCAKIKRCLADKLCATKGVADAIFDPLPGVAVPSEICLEFVEIYNYFEIEEGLTDSELGKVNVWSINEHCFDYSLDIVTDPEITNRVCGFITRSVCSTLH